MENSQSGNRPEDAPSASSAAGSMQPNLGVEKAELPSFIKDIDPTMWKASFGFSFALLGIVFVVNAATLVLTGLFTGWDLWGPAEALIGGPFALLVLSVFGSLTSSVDIFIDVPLTLRLVPLLSTLALLVGATLLANRIGGSQRPSHYGSSAVLSLAPAIAIAAVTTIIAVIFPVEVGVLGTTLELSAASFGNFIWLVIVFTVLIFTAKMGPDNNVVKIYGQKVLDFIGRSSLSGGLFFVGFSGVLVAIVSLFTELDFVPWELSLLLAGVVVTSGSALVALSQVELSTGFFGGDVGVFSDTFEALEVGGIVLILVVSLLLTGAFVLLRRGGRLGDNSFWIRTPIAFAIIGIITTLLSSVQLTGIGQTLSIGAVVWTFALFIVWGVVVEALTRYTGAYVVKIVPGGLRGRLMGETPQER